MSGKEVIFLHDFYSNLIWSCHFHRRIQTSFSCLSILGRQLRNLCVPQRKNLCRAESQQLSEIVLWKSLATQPSCYLMQSAVNIFQHRPDSLKLHQVPRGSEDFTLDSMIHQKITIHKTPFLAVASRFFFLFPLFTLLSCSSTFSQSAVFQRAGDGTEWGREMIWLYPSGIADILRKSLISDSPWVSGM